MHASAPQLLLPDRQASRQLHKLVCTGCRSADSSRYTSPVDLQQKMIHLCMVLLLSVYSGLQSCQSCWPPSFFLSRTSSRPSSSKICSNCRPHLQAGIKLPMCRYKLHVLMYAFWCVFSYSLHLFWYKLPVKGWTIYTFNRLLLDLRFPFFDTVLLNCMGSIATGW